MTDVTIDWRVFLFAISLCCASSVGFGLAPALPGHTRRPGGRVEAGRSARRRWADDSSSLRSALVVAQIALSFVLVIGAGLLFRSFLTLMSVQLGFRTDALLVMYAHAPAGTLDDYLSVTQFETELFQRIRQLPGVVSVAGAMGLPTGEYGSNGGYVLDGQGTMQHHAQDLPQADFSLSSPGYFSTMGIPRLRGRDFTDADRYGSESGRHHQRSARAAEFPERGSDRPSTAMRPRRREHAMDDDRRRGRQRAAGFAGVPGSRRRCTCPWHNIRIAPTKCRWRFGLEVDPSSLIEPVKRIVAR